MKSITEHLNDMIIAESFGSSRLQEIIMSIRRSDCRKTILSEMQFDKISDSDYQELDPEEARSLVYKKDSTEYILWLDKSGNAIARTIGFYTVMPIVSSDFLGNRPTAKRISKYANSAIVISNPDKFDTDTIKRLRREQKQGAIALKSAAEIAEENRNRYAKMISDKSFSDLYYKDISKLVKEAMDSYVEFSSNALGMTSVEGISIDAIRDLTNRCSRLNNMIASLMSSYGRLAGYVGDYAYWRESEKEHPIPGVDMSAPSRECVLEQVETIKRKISAYNELLKDLEQEEI